MSADRPPDLPPPLQPGDCHVWLARADDAHPRLWQFLDAVERARLAALRRSIDRDHFVVGCGMVRLALSIYLGRPPTTIQISRACPKCGRPHGKPRLVGPRDCNLQFSLSHAGGRVIAAVALGMPVGIDIEPGNPHLAVEHLLPYALTPDECAVLQSMRDDERGDGFLVYWTRKEALAKALGLGLALSLTDFHVSAPAESPRLVEWSHDVALSSWPTMFELDAGPGFVAALAVMGDCRAIATIDGSAVINGAAVADECVAFPREPPSRNAANSVDVAYFSASDRVLTGR